MPVDVTKYMQELMDAAEITDAEQKKHLETIFGKPKFKERITNTLSDVEAERGRYAKEKERADAIEKQRQSEYQQNLQIYERNKKAVEEANANVQRYVDTYGELPGGGDPANPRAREAAVADAIDKKTFDERLKQTEGLTIGLVKSVGKITALHMKNFNEAPDFDAIEKIAVEQNLTAEKAYDEWVRPRVQERSQKEFDDKLKTAREEGYREGASKRAAGTLSDAEPQSPFMSNLRKANAEVSTPRESFVSAWRESVTK